jgi:hypothetical protein
MDKKILLSGAAALIMGAGLFAAPASASITIEHSGEATLTATFNDTCQAQASALNQNLVVKDADNSGGGGAVATGTLPAIATFLGATYAEDEDNADDTQFQSHIASITGDGTNAALDSAAVGNITFVDNTCPGNAKNPVWATDSKLDWSASGTLANGLSVSTNQDKAINLSGAFGSVNFESGGDSAVKAAHVGGDGDIKVAGTGFEGHALNTDGTANMVVTYQAPSMGGMDLFVSYAPNSAGTKYDNAAYTDTIGFGASFNMDAMSISAGYETATANTAGNCDWVAAVTVGVANIGASDLIDDVYGTDECGDQTLMAFGASMSAGGINQWWLFKTRY